jgi:hypothetical protein
METISCPSCAAANEAGSSFCQSCGSPIGAMLFDKPRVVSAESAVITSPGFFLHKAQLLRSSRAGLRGLIAIATFCILGAGLLLLPLLWSNSSGPLPQSQIVLLGVVLGLCGFYWILSFIAETHPLIPAVIGLIIFAVNWALDLIGSIAVLFVGPHFGSFRATVLIFLFIDTGIRLWIVLALVRGIRAGAALRSLMSSRPVPTDEAIREGGSFDGC